MRRTVLLLASMVALGTLALPAMAQSDQFRADQIRLDVESGRLDPWTACHDEGYFKVYGKQYCDGAVGDEDPSNDDFTVADALKTIDCPPSPACIGTEPRLSRALGDTIGSVRKAGMTGFTPEGALIRYAAEGALIRYAAETVGIRFSERAAGISSGARAEMTE